MSLVKSETKGVLELQDEIIAMKLRHLGTNDRAVIAHITYLEQYRDNLLEKLREKARNDG